MGRVGDGEVVGDGVGVAGRLAEVAGVLQADRPEHHLGGVVDGHAAGRSRARSAESWAGVTRRSADSTAWARISEGSGKRAYVSLQVGAGHEDPGSDQVEVIDRREVRQPGRRGVDLSQEEWKTERARAELPGSRPPRP